MNYKKIFTITLGAIIITSILAPVLIWAQNENVNTGAKNFCARLSTTASKIDQRIINRDAKLESKQTEILNKIEARRDKRGVKIAEKRAKWDLNRVEHFAKLETKTQTDEQKQAVIAFTRAVQTAITTRRAAIDTAIQDFQQGINEAHFTRKSSADIVIGIFRNSITSAFEKAESDCENGIDPKTIRENLRTDLKTARENFVSDKQKIEKIKTPMETLITARQEAIKQAIDDFKAAVIQARDDFKTAFPPESEESPQE